MGLLLSVFSKLKKKKDVRVLLIGKTTVLKQMGVLDLYTEQQKKEDKKALQDSDEEEEIDMKNTVPTVGFNVKEVKYKNLNFLVWDLGGQSSIRSLWVHYYKGTTGIIYVLDSSAKHRIKENVDQLKTCLSDEELKGCPLLIFANKNDVEGAFNTQQVIEQFNLEDIIGNSRSWFVQSCCALTGDGLLKGLNWFVSEMDKQK